MHHRVQKMFLCFAALACAALLAACGAHTVGEHDTVMQIAGQPVVKAEYQMVLKGYVSEVKRQYTTEEANAKGFWAKGQEGGEDSPLWQVMELTKQDLLRKKTVASLAKEAGLAEQTDYVSILGQMEQENTKRGKDASSGQAIYGLSSFVPEDYYSYVYTDLEARLIERLKKDHPISEEELELTYQENISQYMSDVRVKMLVGEMRVESGMELAKQAAEDMASGENPESGGAEGALGETEQEALTEKYPEINFYEIEMSSYDPQEGKSGAYTQRWLVASAMEQGEVCVPFQIGGHLMVMRCLSREEQTPEPLEAIKGALESELQTSLAKDDIESQMQQAEISYQQKTLEQIAKEALD